MVTSAHDELIQIIVRGDVDFIQTNYSIAMRSADCLPLPQRHTRD
jgi:hypothetical protein